MSVLNPTVNRSNLGNIGEHTVSRFSAVKNISQTLPTIRLNRRATRIDTLQTK